MSISQPRRGTFWGLAALAVLTVLLGLGAALAPVTADDPVVTWPRAGQAPTSTVLPLSPYRPLSLQATVPCATVQALDARGGGAALYTLPADVDDGRGEGLRVSVRGGRVTLTASGARLLSEPVPDGNCRYTVRADAGGIRVDRGGVELTARPGLLPPQVAELATDAEGLPAARGLAVRLHTDARYESTPTALKIALLVAHGLALAALLVLGWRLLPGARGGANERHSRSIGSNEGAARSALVRPRLSLADVGVLGVSLVWTVLGPIGIDDSWYLLMARNATESGYIGNYIYQFNVTENPFSTSQYLMQAWGMLGGWGLLWMRVLPLTYGLGTYALLRVLLTTVLGPRVGRRRAVPWALAVGHLVWWLPYGITLRPEPLVVLCTAGVMLLGELARRRRSVGVLAVAAAVAALALTVAPTGIVAAVVGLAMALPWLWHWLVAAGWPQRIGALGLLVASTSLVVLPAVADATLGNIAESIAVHQWYYRTYPWFRELFAYQNLLSPTETGAWGKRLPVLLTVAALVAAAVAAGRRSGTGGRSGRLLARAAVLAALALAALALVPTKWVNHFPAAAAPGALLLAAAMLRSPVPRRAPAAGWVLAAVAAGVAAAVSFAGPNLWRPFSDWGQPFGRHDVTNELRFPRTAPAFGPLELHSPLLWLAVGLAAVWWIRRMHRRGRPVGLSPDRALLSTAAGLGVVLMLGVFAYAPLAQYPGPSVASMNLQALTGSPCGFAGDVRVRTAQGVVPVTEVIDGRPVFADQASAALWPCADQIAIENGIAQAPAVRLRTGVGLEDNVTRTALRTGNGGTLAQVARTARFVELPSKLTPQGAPILQWGHVELLIYEHPVGLVDVRIEHERRWGWERLPTLAQQDYAGRKALS